MSRHIIRRTLKVKVCTKCKRTLPVKWYGRHTQTKDGLQCRCRECINATMVLTRARKVDAYGRSSKRRKIAVDFMLEDSEIFLRSLP